MAVRTYIGSRYVPKFMGLYNATQDYEALCVVDNGMGTSYITKKPAPAGTLLTDTDYWAVYGASSGAILNLQEQINFINSLIQLKNKTIAIFGASNELAAYTQNDNWTERLSNMLAGYATVLNKSTAGRTLIQSINDYIADVDKNDYDIIIFCSTKNYYISQAELSNNNLAANSPIAQAMASLSPYVNDSQTVYFASCTPYSDYHKRTPMCIYDGFVSRAAAYYGFKTIDMHSWLGVADDDASAYTYDSLHFKAEVAPIFASKALQALLKGGEPFSNYSCILRGSDLETYLKTNFSLPADITLDSNSVFLCNANLDVYLAAWITNTGENIIPSGTYLINAGTGNTIFAKPSYMYKVEEQALNGSITVTSRAFGLQINADLAVNGRLLLTFGNMENIMRAVI